MAVFTVQLEDKVSGPAESAAASVGSLSEQFEALQKQLSAVEQMQANAFKFHDKEAYKPASESDILADIKKQQQANLAMHDQNRDAEIGLAKHRAAAHEQAASAARAEKMSLADLYAGYQMYGEAINIVVSRIKAVVGVLASAVQMAIALTQEKDQLRATFDVFTDGMGDKLLNELEDLAAELPFTADKLNAWAKSLLAAGIKGDALKTSIKAIAAATAIMGESGGQAAQNLIKRFALMAETGQKVSLDRKILSQLAEAGVSVQALAKQLGVAPEKLSEMKLGAKELGEAMQKALIAQGAGPLAKLGMTWGSIAAKVKEGFEDAFEDLGDLVEPLMKEIQSLASEFFAGSVAANDWKAFIKAAFTDAFQAAARFVNWIHVGFLEAQIAVLKFRIAIRPITSTIDELVPKGMLAKGMLEALKVAFIAAAAAAVVVGVAMFIAMLPLMILVGVIGLVIYGLYRLASAAYEQVAGMLAWAQATAMAGDQVLDAIKSTVTGAAAALVGFPLAAAEAGLNFVLGLVQAITSGQGPVADAVRALASSAIAAIKGALGIASPSRVMMTMGDYTTQGLVSGIAGGEGDVERAAQGAGMAAVSGVDAGLSQGGGGAAGGKAAKGRTEIRVEAGAVVIHGAGGDIMALTEEALALLLERLAAKAGV